MQFVSATEVPEARLGRPKFSGRSLQARAIRKLMEGRKGSWLRVKKFGTAEDLYKIQCRVSREANRMFGPGALETRTATDGSLYIRFKPDGPGANGHGHA